MRFSKTFPKEVEGSNFPKWEEVYLTEEEEREQEEFARKENTRLMKQCIEDANDIIAEKNLKPFQTNVVNIAIALFGKLASHSVYWREGKAKEKFDQQKQ